MPILAARDGSRLDQVMLISVWGALALGALPDDQRSSIQHDRDTALQILLERGFLDGAALEQALAAPLGTLFTLDPIRRSTP